MRRRIGDVTVVHDARGLSRAGAASGKRAAEAMLDLTITDQGEVGSVLFLLARRSLESGPVLVYERVEDKDGFKFSGYGLGPRVDLHVIPSSPMPQCGLRIAD